jgi:hypothetical protein
MAIITSYGSSCNWLLTVFAIGAEAHARGIKSDEWSAIFACVVEDWALYGNSQVSDTKLDHMFTTIIPMAIDRALSTGDKTMPFTSARAMHHVVEKASGFHKPVIYSAEICRKCNKERLDQDHCDNCPSIRVPGQGLLKTADWVTEEVLIWDLGELVKEWLADDEVAPGLFNRLHELALGRTNTSLTAERPRFFDEVLDHRSDGEARRLQLMYHSDAFSPCRTRPNSFSLTYGILCALLGASVSHKRSALKLWFLSNGRGGRAEHMKSTSWFEHILIGQVKMVLMSGVRCDWKHEMTVPCAGTELCHCNALGRGVKCECTHTYHPGPFMCHALISVSCSDQPATCMNCGRISHNAMNACR